MALLAHVNSFAGSTSSTNQTISGVGFEPKALIFFGNQLASTGTAPDASLSWGFASSTLSTSQGSQSIACRDNISSAVTGSFWVSSIFSVFTVGGATSTTALRAGRVAALSTDGFDVAWTAVNATPHRTNFLALGGDDITNARAFNLPLSTGASGSTQRVSVGFQPDLLLFMSANDITAGFQFALCGMGMATSTTAQGCITGQSEDVAAAADSYRQLLSTLIYDRGDFAGGSTLQVALDEIVADGFVLRIVKRNVTPFSMNILAIKGGSYAVGTFDSPTSSGSQAISTLAFTPKALCLLSANDTPSTAHNAHMRLTMGAASGPANRAAIWCGDQDAAATMICDQALSTVSVFEAWLEGTPTLEARADLTSFDATGWTLNWPTVNSTARQILYFAAGDTPVDPGVSNSSPFRFLTFGIQ